jgi:hypothetical protein
MRELELHFLHGTGAFVQFEPAEPGDPGIDLMFVDAVTWEKLLESSRKDQAAGHEVRMPKPSTLSPSPFMQPQARPAANRKPTGRTSGRSFESADWTSRIRNFGRSFAAVVAKRLFIE